jgi:ABC-type nitrate/sulfonate/bicarbonate transport system substrate-binding protein/outer membrane protein OmpA-like peptidoglycan-associated protein
MSTSRIAFWVLMAAAVIVIAASLAVRAFSPAARPVATAIPVTLIPSGANAARDAPSTAVAPTVAPADAKLQPIWGPNYKAGDGLPTFTCAAYAFSADYVLQQIQMSGLDIKHGFHLGIVPFYLNENYVVTVKTRMATLQSGQTDCLLTTFDSIALDDPGIITAFINESAGGDQIWARDIATLNDLKGKRIAFEAFGPSEFFVLDLLNTVRISPNEVQLLPQPNQDAAIDAFNRGDADVVSGWEPVIRRAEQGGGAVLASSRDFRSILGAVVMSRQAMRNKRPVVQQFHDAWFEALDLQQSNFDAAAKQIADWGHNAYTGVGKDKPADDLRTMLQGVAQADLADNSRAFRDVPRIVERLRQTRNLWASAGYPIPTTDISAVIDASFVQGSARGKLISPNAVNRFANSTFALGRDAGIPVVAGPSAPDATVVPAAPAATAAPEPTKVQEIVVVAPTEAAPSASSAVTQAVTATQADARAVATLPCSRFDFLPDSAELTESAKETLLSCAVPILRQSPGLLLRVKGSSAWPGPAGTFAQADIESVARSRSQAIAQFLAAQGIAKNRLFVTWTLPPPERRETDDLLKQAEDRYVELALLVSGR